MTEYSKISFGEFVRNTLTQLAFLVALAILLYFLTYQLTDSNVYSTFSVLAFVVFRQILFGGRLKRRARQVESIFLNTFPVGGKINLADLNDGWLKGVGFIDDMNQPMWVRFSGEYFELFFLARSRQPPFLILPEEIEKVTFCHADKSLAKLKIKNLDIDVIIPWSEKAHDEWSARLSSKGGKRRE